MSDEWGVKPIYKRLRLRAGDRTLLTLGARDTEWIEPPVLLVGGESYTSVIDPDEPALAHWDIPAETLDAVAAESTYTVTYESRTIVAGHVVR